MLTPIILVVNCSPFTVVRAVSTCMMPIVGIKIATYIYRLDLPNMVSMAQEQLIQ